MCSAFAFMSNDIVTFVGEFMKMAISVKRRLSAWLLLLVFVPMMVATSLHVHDVAALSVAECEQCLHHVHHDGHIGTYAENIHDCVLCQFANLPFIAATAVLFTVTFAYGRVEYASFCANVRVGVFNVKSVCAPPVAL